MLHSQGYFADAILDLVGSIGDASFYDELATLLFEQFAVENIYLFGLDDDTAKTVATYSRDRSGRAHEHAAVYDERRLWLVDHPAPVAGHTPSGRVAIVIDYLKSSPIFELRRYGKQMRVGCRTAFMTRKSTNPVGLTFAWPEAMGRLPSCPVDMQQVVDTVLPFLARHEELRRRNRRLPVAVSTLSEIIPRIQTYIGDSRPREIEVAARLIKGQTAGEIATDLSISTETVVTHRKRIYEHIGVQGCRELLLWYVEKYGAN